MGATLFLLAGHLRNRPGLSVFTNRRETALDRNQRTRYFQPDRHGVRVDRHKSCRTTPQRFIVSDGGSGSKVWMQIVANVLQQKLHCLHGHPGSCLGAAFTAAIGTGLADDWGGIAAFTRFAGEILPDSTQAQIYRDGYKTFRDLYARTSARNLSATGF